jgi:cation diffusion facilitator CzcD-associated flavoprotein CzcO
MAKAREVVPEVGHIWRNRWDSLKLFTPSQYDNLPGLEFPAPADTYPTKDPVAGYLQASAQAFKLPVRLNTPVTELRRVGDTFEVRTTNRNRVSYAGSGRSLTTCFITSVEFSRCTPGSAARVSSSSCW